MLLSIFSSLYELIISENADYPEYRDGIFDSVGLITLIFSVVTALIFYLLLGRWKPIFYKLKHWLLIIVILAIGTAYFALSQARGDTGIEGIDAYMIRFAIINALYATMYFIALSLLLKKASIFAKNTPF